MAGSADKWVVHMYQQGEAPVLVRKMNDQDTQQPSIIKPSYFTEAPPNYFQAKLRSGEIENY